MITENLGTHNDTEVSSLHETLTLCVSCGEMKEKKLTVRLARTTDNAQIAKGGVCEDCAGTVLRRAEVKQ